MNIGSQPVFDQAGKQRPAYCGEKQNQHDADQNINRLLTGAVVQPVPEIKQSPGVQQQHDGDTAFAVRDNCAAYAGRG